MENLGK
jgi:hypothetical protein